MDPTQLAMLANSPSLMATVYPRETLANIIRSQWQDFQNTALPVKANLEAMTTYDGNKGVIGDLQTQTVDNANNAFGGMVSDTQRQAGRYGMNLTGDQTGTLQRSADLGKTLATVDGMNRAATFQKDLNREVVSGATLSGGRNYS